jgi:aspartyl protease family protein
VPGLDALGDMLGGIPLEYVAAFAAGLVVLVLLMRVPVLGTLIRVGVTLALVGVLVLVLSDRASLSPWFGDVAGKLSLDRQEVVGGEVRIRMSTNGHFYAKAKIDGVERRLMVDSGATVTALSLATAEAAGVTFSAASVPVVIQTANGAVPARTATVKELRLGTITARSLRVVVSPAFGEMNVLGMNFLSRLKSWRVEENVLVLVPHSPQPVEE